MTIIPYTNTNHSIVVDWQHDRIETTEATTSFLKNSAAQLRYFIKSLLETSCFEVWIYSPVQNRCIRLTKENCVRFLETEWTAITSTDGNDASLSNIPHSNDEIEQILLIFTYYILVADHQSIIVDSLKNRRDKNNIILLCHKSFEYFSFLCLQIEDWFPRQKVFPFNFDIELFNPHVHKILLDLVKNPKYDCCERYARNTSLQCSISEKINIFMWWIPLLIPQWFSIYGSEAHLQTFFIIKKFAQESVH